MPHSTFKMGPTWIDAGVVKCSCGQTFGYKSESERNTKIQMHKEFCGKLESSTCLREPKKAVMPEELQCTKAERMKEIHK